MHQDRVTAGEGVVVVVDGDLEVVHGRTRGHVLDAGQHGGARGRDQGVADLQIASCDPTTVFHHERMISSGGQHGTRDRQPQQRVRVTDVRLNDGLQLVLARVYVPRPNLVPNLNLGSADRARIAKDSAQDWAGSYLSLIHI